jgi:hypothetical protein
MESRTWIEGSFVTLRGPCDDVRRAVGSAHFPAKLALDHRFSVDLRAFRGFLAAPDADQHCADSAGNLAHLPPY